MTSVIIILIAAAALVLGLALAYLPMKLLVATMGRNIRQFIQRQRDRRVQARETPDRRKAPDPTRSG